MVKDRSPTTDFAVGPLAPLCPPDAPPPGRVLRAVLEGALPFDSDLEAFCIDHFPKVYRLFGRGMNRTEKENLLLTTVEHTDLWSRLRITHPQHCATVTAPGTPPEDLLSGQSSLRTPAFANLLDEYLGSAEAPALFGGREAELDQLEAWLSTHDAPPYFLLIAPPGRGKTALLVHFWDRVRDRSGLHAVLCPISLRFGMHRADEVLARVVDSLLCLHQRPPIEARAPSLDRLQKMMAELLQTPLPAEQTLVLILDGIDELLGLSIDLGLFPRQLGRGVRVVLSMREGADECSVRGWQDRLGLARADLAQTVALPLLSRAAIDSILNGMPLLGRQRCAPHATELLRLSNGDPLLLGLYIRSLCDAEVPLDVRELPKLQPGFDEFFARWWRDQQRLWGERRPYVEPLTKAIMGVLSCALGPLLQCELMAVLPAAEAPSALALADGLRPLARFVYGDGLRQGYSYSHPYLAETFVRKLHPQQREHWRRALVDYGRRVISDLVSSKEDRIESSQYVIRYHSAHLEQVGAPATDFVALAQPSWRRASVQATDGFAAFQMDMRRALAACERWDTRRVADGQEPEHLGGAMCCSLYLASLHSLAMNVPAELLTALLKRGGFPLERVLGYVRQLSSPRARAEALCQLGQALQQDAPTAGELFTEALQTARRVSDSCARTSCLAGILATLPASLHALGQEVVLAELKRLSPKDDGLAAALIALLPHTPMEYRENLFGWIARYSSHIPIQEQRIVGVAYAISELPEPARSKRSEEFLTQLGTVPFFLAQLRTILPMFASDTEQERGLRLAKRVKPHPHRALALAQLYSSERFPMRLKSDALQACVAAVKDFLRAPQQHVEPGTAGGFLDSASGLPRGLREATEVFNRNMSIAMGELRITNALSALVDTAEESVFGLLTELIEQLPTTEFAEPRSALRLRLQLRKDTIDWDQTLSELALQPADKRLRLLSLLAPKIPVALLARALALCSAIEDGTAQAAALTALSRQEIGIALQAAVVQQIERSAGPSAYPLLALLEAVPPHRRDQVRPAALSALQRLPESNRSLQLAEKLHLYPDEAETLATSLATRLPADGVLSAEQRIEVAAAVLPHLSPEHKAQAEAATLRAVKELTQSPHIGFRLGALARHASAEARNVLLQEALRSDPPDTRLDRLSALVPHLPDAERAQALVAAIAALAVCPIEDGSHSIRTLAPYLTPELCKRAQRALQSSARRTKAQRLVSYFLIKALTTLAEAAPTEQRLGLLHDAHRALRGGSQVKQVEELCKLAKLWPAEKERAAMIERALSLVLSGNDWKDQAMRPMACAELAPLLAPAQWQRLLDVILAECTGYFAHRLIASLIPHMPVQEFDRTLAWSWNHGPQRELWQAMVPRIEGRLETYSFFRDTVRMLTEEPRNEVLYHLAAVAPILPALGLAAADAVTAAVLQVCNDCP